MKEEQQMSLHDCIFSEKKKLHNALKNVFFSIV